MKSIWKNMLESIETRELSCIIRSFVRMTSWIKIFTTEKSEVKADVFVEICGKITVESHVATIGNSDMLLKIVMMG